MPKGGRRQGAGRPPSGETIRKTISWRLPISLLTRIYKNAEFEEMEVTAWVERALYGALRRYPSGKQGA